jgi:hypothetical protein
MSSIQPHILPFVLLDVVSQNLQIMRGVFERFRLSQIGSKRDVPTPEQVIAASIFHSAAREATGQARLCGDVSRASALAAHGFHEAALSDERQIETLRELGFGEGSDTSSWPSIRYTGAIAELDRFVTWRPSPAGGPYTRFSTFSAKSAW